MSGRHRRVSLRGVESRILLRITIALYLLLAGVALWWLRRMLP